MINIENKDLFGKVIAEALVKVDGKSSLQAWEKMRWVNAITKAVCQIEDFGAFMDWQEENQTLLIWSDKSNNIYEANGVCQCQAFEMGQPCWHRAAKRLVESYLAAMENPSPVKSGAAAKIENAPYLKPASDAKPMTVGGMRI
jgi:hypothetical protein